MKKTDKKNTMANPANTELSFGKSGDRPRVRLVSDTTVHEEALEHGRLIGLYWSASGQVQRENTTTGLPGFNSLEFPMQAFDLEIDGQDLRNNWEHVSATERAGTRPNTREAVLELRHRVRPVTLRVVTTLDGTPFFARRLEIVNTGAAPAALARVSPWSGMLWTWNARKTWGELPSVENPFSLGYFAGVQQGTEGDFRWEPLPHGWRRIEGTLGHSGFGNPFFVLRNEFTGETAIGSLAWSGNWYAEFWRDPWRDLSDRPNRGTNLGFRMGPMAPAPQRMIAPGETVVTPAMHLGILHRGMDECIAAWHEHLRASVIPPRPAKKEFFTVAGRVVEEPAEWILREVDIAAEMGVEAFMIDAGWYGDEFAKWTELRGDWWEGKWLPGGLAACRERCHKRGMLFGLWMEPECMGPKSRLLKEHPEWVLRTDNGREVAQTLDLANPDAAVFFRKEVVRVIREHKLDFFKIDYNIRVNEGGQRERDGFTESEGWRHYETVYGTFEEVRRTMPNVALECCASGGGRNDLGMLSRLHYACESDFSMFPRSIRAINGLTLFLPPEALCYYHNHMPLAHQMADLDTHLRVTLFAQPIFVGFGAQNADRTTEYFAKTKRYIELSKGFCRPVLASNPVVYHHTPDIGLYAPAPWCVLEYARRDRTQGFAGVFRLSTEGTNQYLFKPRGLDPARRYVLSLDNQRATMEISGRDLAWNGIPVNLDSANTSELLMWKAK